MELFTVKRKKDHYKAKFVYKKGNRKHTFTLLSKGENC